MNIFGSVFLRTAWKVASTRQRPQLPLLFTVPLATKKKTGAQQTPEMMKAAREGRVEGRKERRADEWMTHMTLPPLHDVGSWVRPVTEE